MKQKEQKKQGSEQEDSEGSEESKRGLDRYSVGLKLASKTAYLLVKYLTSEE